MVAVCRAIMPAALSLEQQHTTPWMASASARPLDLWNNNCKQPNKAFVQRPMAMARSMSNESLHLCTESLGCETGSMDFLQLLDLDDDQPIITFTSAASDSIVFPPPILDQLEEEQATGELTAVRYHRSRPQRAFPPPLPSLTMSRRDGTCTQMRPHRRDGRLVLEAVPARPHGYLHEARRQGGRLTLCLVDCSVRNHTQTQTESTVTPPTPTSSRMVLPNPNPNPTEEHEDNNDDVEEEEDDEVEVVDRGTVVEVVAASGKAQRSRIVINKFVGGTPVMSDVHQQPSRSCVDVVDDEAPAVPGLRRVPSSTRTLAAAVAAASTGMDAEEEADLQEEAETEAEAEEEPATMSKMLLFTSRAGDREELVQSVRRCRQLRQKPLFIVEPYCIATTS